MILSDINKPKFVVSENDMAREFGTRHLIVLSNISFWTEHYEDLIEWCSNNNSVVKGMTVDINDDQTLTAFLLKWQ